MSHRPALPSVSPRSLAGKRWRSRRLALAALLGISWCMPKAAEAAPSTDDGSYGRFDGDMAFALEVGVHEAFPGETMAGRLTTMYLHSAGTYVQYNESFGLARQDLGRSIAGGIEIRPLFMARFGTDLEHGPALLDLFVDSLGIGLGLYAAALSPDVCSDSGLDCWRMGLELGVGVELPLLGHADGPFVGLRGAWRWPTGTAPLGNLTDLDEPGGMVGLTLGYRLTALTHLADAGDLP
jgi:hypothetical protein